MGKNQKPSPTYHHATDTVRHDGIYRVFHADHRLSHEVTLLAGQTFPRCTKCGFAVHYELVHHAPRSLDDSEFRINLYEIPHPDDDQAENDAPDKPTRVA